MPARMAYGFWDVGFRRASNLVGAGVLRPPGQGLRFQKQTKGYKKIFDVKSIVFDSRACPKPEIP